MCLPSKNTKTQIHAKIQNSVAINTPTWNPSPESLSSNHTHRSPYHPTSRRRSRSRSCNSRSVSDWYKRNAILATSIAERESRKRRTKERKANKAMSEGQNGFTRQDSFFRALFIYLRARVYLSLVSYAEIPVFNVDSLPQVVGFTSQ